MRTCRYADLRSSNVTFDYLRLYSFSFGANISVCNVRINMDVEFPVTFNLLCFTTTINGSSPLGDLSFCLSYGISQPFSIYCCNSFSCDPLIFVDILCDFVTCLAFCLLAICRTQSIHSAADQIPPCTQKLALA